MAKRGAIIERQIGEASEARRLLDRATKTCDACGAGTNIFREREEQIIREALAWFEQPGTTKDDHIAVRYIAALSEIRNLRNALEYRVRKGNEAEAALVASDATAG